MNGLVIGLLLAATSASAGQLAPSPSDEISLRLLVDRTSMEVFANEGKVSLSSCFLPRPGSTGLGLFAKGGHPKILSMTVCELKSIWPSQMASQVK